MMDGVRGGEVSPLLEIVLLESDRGVISVTITREWWPGVMLPVLYCRVYCAHYTDIHHPLITLHWPRCQICQFQYKCISLILLMIRGQDKMINYFSKYLGRGGRSSWEASPSSTQSAAANSGMMRELEPGTMQQENIPGFFFNSRSFILFVVCLLL